MSDRITTPDPYRDRASRHYFASANEQGWDVSERLSQTSRALGFEVQSSTELKASELDQAARNFRVGQ